MSKTMLYLLLLVNVVLVSCQCTNNDVRLVDGSNSYEGRVEICINNAWTTVCDENFSANDATVICRQIGYSSLGAHAYGSAHYGSNEDLDIGITNLACNGDETTWADCTYSEVVAACTHSQDAGVQCPGSIGPCENAGFSECCLSGCNQGGCYCDSFCYVFNDCCDDIVKTCPQSECTTGDLRLVNDITPDDTFNGRVELCIDGQYGGICDSSWDNNDAAVVCRQWGDYTPSASVASVDSLYGQPGVSFVATDFQCNGDESTLADCTYTVSSDCGQHNGAGTYCTLLCDDGDMRLVNGSDEYSGRVEICKDLLWHPICDSQWSNADAGVVCNQLGHSSIGHAYGNSLYGGGFNVHIYTDVVCDSNDANIDDCTKSTNIPDSCTAATSAGVVCDVPISDGCVVLGHSECCLSGCYQPAGFCYCDSVCHTFNDCCEDIEETCPAAPCTTGDTRLLKNELVDENEGRVEICINGAFRSICDSDWDVNDATVACRSLGLGLNGVEAVEGGVYGQSSIDIIGAFACAGTEQYLSDCSYSDTVDCGHHEDAGARCPLLCDTEGEIRLYDGPTQYEGRLEVCVNGQWSSVCADDAFCNDAARVVCRQLGLSILRTEAYGNASYGRGIGIVAAENVQCTGDETSVLECTYDTGSTCPHSWDAGVKCYPQSPCEAAGHVGCCESNCYNFADGCWCDSTCYIFNDCCEYIETTCPQAFCLDGEMRFSDGTNNSNGRLEICAEGQWKSVCEHSFDSDEAVLVCLNLGYSTENYTIYQPDVFGQGTGDIIAKTFDCSGNENDLNTCPGDSVCCGHQRDIGMACAPACSEGQIRLVDGATDMEGRVEICYEGRWGTVCDDFWDTDDARVVCKHAGLPWRGAIARGAEYFPSGIGPIFLDNVQCDGSEDSLWSCPANAIESHNCVHYEDAGVTCAAGPCELIDYTDTCCAITDDNSCQGKQDKVCHCDFECDLHNDCCADTDLICKCNENDIRLIGGTNEMEGRVEVCVDGAFGTVCDDFWGAEDAMVVCRQLGLPTIGAEALSFSYFGQGTGDIVLDNVGCVGNETALINCTHNGVNIHNCIHFEDASVRCNNPECTEGGVRLVGGCNENVGRLEVCLSGQWGTVCDDLFSTIDAQVVCKSLGLDYTDAQFIQFASFIFGFADGPINIDDVQCDGSENHILDCEYITDHNCIHFEDVGIRCDALCPNEGEIRLVDGAINDQGQAYQGRVEICLNGHWGTICDDQYDVNDAKAICRQLNLPTESARAYQNLQFGRGFGEIHYSELGCTGDEAHVFDCPKQTSFFCSHFEDIGVSCEAGCSDGQVRLASEETCGDNVVIVDNEGRLEVCKDGSWGVVCDDTDSFGTNEARVACRTAGQPYTAAQVFNPPSGPDPVHYSNVNCNGNEDDFGDCSKNGNTECTNHNFDVGVTCRESCDHDELRLVDGTDQTNGRLEICIGGLWGTVCDEDFDSVDGQVACKQMGLSYEGAEVVYGGAYGYGDDHVAITSLFCTGSENKLSDCIYQTGTAIDCQHANDVGVICQDLCCDGDIRLAGGEADNSGRVEVCFNGQWGTICDTAWTTEDAQVACYQLGYERTPVRTFGGSKYGPGVNDVYFTNLQCAGTETKLVSCLYDFDTSECDHSHDAGLRCDGPNRDVNPDTLSCLPSTSCNDCFEDIMSPTQSPNTNPGPTSVTNFVPTVVNATYAIMTWDEPMQANGIITGYCVYVEDKCADSPRSWSFSLKGTDERRVVLDSLVGEGRPFTYYVTTTNYYRCGDVTTDTFATTQNVPVSAPVITGQRTSDYTMTVNWVGLSYCDTRGSLQGYQLRWGVYATKDSVIPSTQSLSPDATSLILPGGSTNLLVYEEYYVEIAAENEAGVGPYSMVVIPATNSTTTSITIQLPNNQPCGTWTADDTANKISDINAAIVDAINEQCSCGFTVDHLYGGAFSCDTNNDGVVTYTVTVYISPDINTGGITDAVNNWYGASPSINVGGVTLEIGQPQSSTNAGLIVGVIIAVVAFIVIVIVIVVVIVVIFRYTRVKYQGGEAFGNDIVGYSNRMAFPEGQGEDNISQHMGSTVHDDDFQEAINMISDDIEKQKVAEYDTVPPSSEHVYFGQK